VSGVTRLLAIVIGAALLAGCPPTPHCHCQLSDRCVELAVDCNDSNVTCNGRDGKDGRCATDGGVGSCVVEGTRTDYFYATEFTTDSARAQCDGGFFTPLP
jgi:hypothetical protein